MSATFELLPAIDLRDGRVVRLVEGDFERETTFGDDPAAVARGFVLAGARWLHVVDLDAARTGERSQAGPIARIVATAGVGTQVQVGGGIRDERAADDVLGAGAARIVVGTAALRDPALAGRLIHRHGPGRIAAAIDVRDGRALGDGWAPGADGLEATQAVRLLADQGVETFAVTAIERDGRVEGPDVALLERMIALDRGAIIASGGVSSIGDVVRVRSIGCTGVIIGRALYDGRLHLAEALAATKS